MKGLLMKDWKIILHQGRALIGIGIFMIVWSLLQGDASLNYGVSYSIFVMTIFTISTISYDEYENGMKYLLSLPVSKRTYVCEKYLFGMILAGSVWLLSSIGGILFSLAGRMTGLDEYLVSNLAVVLAAILVLAIALPVIFYFGAEKGRSIYFGILAVIFCCAIAFFKLNGNVWLMDSPCGKMIMMTMHSRPWLSVTIGLLIYMAVIAGSYHCAVKIMEHREFS